MQFCVLDSCPTAPHLLLPAFLPCDRRRGELTAVMLSSLADDSWKQLDLAGCSKLYGAELLAAAAKMPKLAALDVTGTQLQDEGARMQVVHAHRVSLSCDVCVCVIEHLGNGGRAPCRSSLLQLQLCQALQLLQDSSFVAVQSSLSCLICKDVSQHASRPCPALRTLLFQWLMFHSSWLSACCHLCVCTAGCGRISAGGWRQLANAWPHLRVIRLGGSAECSEASLKALPHILPGVQPPSHRAAAAASLAAAAGPVEAAAGGVADSWEDAFASDNDDDQVGTAAVLHVPSQGSMHSRIPLGCSTGNSSSSDGEVPDAKQGSVPPANGGSSGGSVVGCGRLKQLQALIWPDVPSAAVELVQQRCPRVLINPPMRPDKLTGEMPPREWDPQQALDEPYMQVCMCECMCECIQWGVYSRVEQKITRCVKGRVHAADKAFVRCWQAWEGLMLAALG
jgi:hypothetical protein